ncbi:histidine phosphatase family protein [Rufibacter latericius]|uniref:Histidine phosphatase family protein n=1 Tax=Rufibacter latericius TaxID=2487040 RepID=A0A3M9MKE6_9BACT|nr:histidine phosphatase family protein [Rufibacter latericius]RNI25675.1 histidine phosphatase family protein [Rufibacter latericius]
MLTPPVHIYLIRHARPLINQKGFFTKAQAEQYMQDYNVAEVEKIIERSEHLPLARIKRVFCSTLPRAKTTALMLFGAEVELLEDATFKEFENRIWGLPLGKFPLKWWQVTSRILWLLGMNQKDIESFRQAKVRADQAAEHLVREAEVQGLAVLVAHGFLNEFIKRALKKRGWKVVRDGGRGYVGVTQLEK